MQNRRFLTARQMRERYGGISDMTLWRWVRDPKLEFPQPIYLNNRRLWDAAEQDEFDDRQRQRAA